MQEIRSKKGQKRIEENERESEEKCSRSSRHAKRFTDFFFFKRLYTKFIFFLYMQETQTQIEKSA